MVKTRHVTNWIGVLLLASVSLPVVTTNKASGQGTTIWDGVYTVAQAQRGRELYVKWCGYCHRDDLAGGGSDAGAPALQGSAFMVRWRDKPLAELFTTIGLTMPQNAPDSLPPQVVADIVSLLLQANGAPPGMHELAGEMGAFRNILFTDTR